MPTIMEEASAPEGAVVETAIEGVATDSVCEALCSPPQTVTRGGSFVSSEEVVASAFGSLPTQLPSCDTTDGGPVAEPDASGSALLAATLPEASLGQAVQVALPSLREPSFVSRRVGATLAYDHPFTADLVELHSEYSLAQAFGAAYEEFLRTPLGGPDLLFTTLCKLIRVEHTRHSLAIRAIMASMDSCAGFPLTGGRVRQESSRWLSQIGADTADPEMEQLVYLFTWYYDLIRDIQRMHAVGPLPQRVGAEETTNVVAGYTASEEVIVESEGVSQEQREACQRTRNIASDIQRRAGGQTHSPATTSNIPEGEQGLSAKSEVRRGSSLYAALVAATAGCTVLDARSQDTVAFYEQARQTNYDFFVGQMVAKASVSDHSNGPAPFPGGGAVAEGVTGDAQVREAGPDEIRAHPLLISSVSFRGSDGHRLRVPPCLLDTGGSFSVMDEQTCKHMERHGAVDVVKWQESNEQLNMHGVGGVSVHVVGRCTVEF